MRGEIHKQQLVNRELLQQLPLAKTGDVLLIVPPLHSVELAPYGVCLLQAVARRAGTRVDILFANMLFAEFIGVDRHHELCWNEGASTFSEALFSHAAHGLNPFRDGLLEMGESGQGYGEAHTRFAWNGGKLSENQITALGFDPQGLSELQSSIASWVDQLADVISSWSYRFIGATCNFSQINASLAVLRRVKTRRPNVVTLLGGSNCLGDASEGVAALAPYIDHVFAGESELLLVDLIQGKIPQNLRIVPGQRNIDLSSLPIPCFDDYFAQGEHLISNWEAYKKRLYLPYETSRGCWWGVKHHCTFCGEFSVPFPYRFKSADKVVADLETISTAFECPRFFVVDSIMPHQYFKSLLPTMARNQRKYELFYEQKANLGIEKIKLLKEAGVKTIQPGIESFSTPLLETINKGVKSYQNIQLLRYARSVGVELFYWLLWGFPGDKRAWYEETIDIVNLIHHLPAPDGLVKLIISRHSPYFLEPAKFGIGDLSPAEWYSHVFPKGAPVSAFVNVFNGNFDSESVDCSDIRCRLTAAIDAWIAVWQAGEASSQDKFFRAYERRAHPAKQLNVEHVRDRYVLTDTRGLAGSTEEYVLDKEFASVVLAARPYSYRPELQWALDAKLAIILDDWYVPLATASAELLTEFESELSLSNVRSNANEYN